MTQAPPSACWTDTPASSPTTSGTPDAMADEPFIRHRVRRRDTLAGLAIRYNATVGDIKRANGLQSDTAMFGKEFLLIPTKPLSIGSEYSAWTGMTFHRTSASSSRDQLRPSFASALSSLRGYYSMAGTPNGLTDEDEDSDGEQFVFDRCRPLPGEVELMTRTSAPQNTPAYIEERLRRRRNAEEDGIVRTDGSGASGPDDDPLIVPRRNALFHSVSERLSGTNVRRGFGRSGSAGGSLSDLREWHRKSLVWRDHVIDRLRKAASQPLIRPGTPIFSQAEALALNGSFMPPGPPGLQSALKEGPKAD